MTVITTFTSRDFTRKVAAVKRAAATGPVFVTDRDRTAFVLLRIEDYDRLSARKEASLLDIMDAIPDGGGNIDFVAPTLHVALPPVDHP
jgi:prevent-host-death family protein